MMRPCKIVIEPAETAVLIPSSAYIHPIKKRQGALKGFSHVAAVYAKALERGHGNDREPEVVILPGVFQRVNGPFPDPVTDGFLFLVGIRVPEYFRREAKSHAVRRYFGDGLICESVFVPVGESRKKKVALRVRAEKHDLAVQLSDGHGHSVDGHGQFLLLEQRGNAPQRAQKRLHLGEDISNLIGYYVILSAEESPGGVS